MKLITQRTIIQGVYSAWMRQYPKDKDGIGAKLKKLDLDTCEPGVIDALIGNTSWTALPECDECGTVAKVSVEIGQEPDYESSTATICTACLKKAVALASAR